MEPFNTVTLPSPEQQPPPLATVAQLVTNSVEQQSGRVLPVDGVMLVPLLRVEVCCLRTCVILILYVITATCSDLPVPTNGLISYSPDTSPILEGAMATYVCMTGYRPSSGPDRVCQSDRTWSGGVITCQSELCYIDALKY